MPERPRRRRAMPVRWSDRLTVGLITAVFAVVGYAHRWVTDDGLIFGRIARQIAAGNGPVTNVGERVEAATSTLWVWLLAGLSLVFRIGDPTGLAIALGLVLSTTGIALALSATRRLHRTTSPTATLVPAGALVILALPPFWTFATSGMETGLEFAWAGTWWWVLVGLWMRGREERPVSLRRWIAIGVFFGLGPLVRPDFAIFAVIGMLAAGLLATASRRRWISLVVAAVVIPAAYEVFRLGYYGLPYPMPAAAKGATDSLWWRGWLYVLNYVEPYWLWIPALAAVGCAVAVAWRRRPARATWILLGAPLVASLIEAIYVVKVGGDFMHGRMWLIPTLLLLAPILLVPARKATLPAIAVLGVWALVGGVIFGGVNKGTATRYKGAGVIPGWIWDEHVTYTTLTHRSHPTRASQHVDGHAALPVAIVEARLSGKRVMVFDPQYARQDPLPLGHRGRGQTAIIIGRLGAGGFAVPLDTTVIDVFGLSNPIGGFITADHRNPVGHQKLLPPVWNVALYTDAADDAEILDLVRPGLGINARNLAAARHTLTCGPVKELLEAESAPLTFSRFLHNITGAFGRTTLVIPRSPVAAERKFCGRD